MQAFHITLTPIDIIFFVAGILFTAIIILLVFLGKKCVHYLRAKNFITNHSSIDGTKDEFLSFATHQLRSPLTSLKWGLETLLDQKEVNQNDVIKKLQITTDDMISTVNDLLDISKIDQGHIEVNKEPIDLVCFLQEETAEFTAQAKQKKLTLYFDTQITTALFLGDRTKLRQVINNIIDNAIKYTEHGGIIINLTKNTENNNYIITISDTGTGISEQEINTLFEKFKRGSAGKSSFGGSGLGLYLSKKIIEMHKGTIRVTSDGIGKGSIFIITLPDTHTLIA
jgi:signal transduction histidine kinase